MKGQMRIYYDEEGDFLEITIGNPTRGEASEIQPGIFIRKNEKTNEIISVGVLGFKKRIKTQDIDFSLPVNIEITS